MEEVDALLGHIDFIGHLDWDSFIRMWQRIVRRVLLGARDRDEEPARCRIISCPSGCLRSMRRPWSSLPRSSIGTRPGSSKHTSSPPETCLQDRTDQDCPLAPFSGGPAMRPGRNVVLLVASVALARLVQQRSFDSDAGLIPTNLPGLLDPFRLQFAPTR